MAFCSNCGNQLSDNAKFCAQCGTVVTAKPQVPSGINAASMAGVSAIPGPGPIAVPVASAAPPPPVQPVAPPVHVAAPVHYVPAGQMPVAVGMPPVQAVQKKGGMLGTIIVLALVAVIGYYYYNKTHNGTNIQANNPPVTQPPSTNNPPSNPPGGGNGGNASLLHLQQLNAEWKAADGFIVVDAKWTNSSNVGLSSAVMECDQYDSVGTDLSQFRMTLNGPTPPNTWSSYNNVRMGEAANGVNKLVCNLVHVTPSN
jgi:hypothetical protein